MDFSKYVKGTLTPDQAFAEFLRTENGNFRLCMTSPSLCKEIMACASETEFMANIKKAAANKWWVTFSADELEKLKTFYRSIGQDPRPARLSLLLNRIGVEVHPELTQGLFNLTDRDDFLTEVLLTEGIREVQWGGYVETAFGRIFDGVSLEEVVAEMEEGKSANLKAKMLSKIKVPSHGFEESANNIPPIWSEKPVNNLRETQPTNLEDWVPDTPPPFGIQLRPMTNKVNKVDIFSEPDISMLNPEQMEAFTTVMETLAGNRDESHILLTGPAGTGKTFVTQKIIHRLLFRNPDLRIVMSAPTHKAVGVSRNMSPFANNQKEYQWEVKDRRQQEEVQVNYMTVHKMLSLIPTRNEKTNWVEKFLPNPRIKHEEIPILGFDVVFVDEASMLDGGDGGLLTQLLKHSDRVMFVFIGDDAQLEPVETSGIKSPVFIESFRKRHGIGHAALKTVMRQALDNPVLALATQVRKDGDYVRQNSESESGRVLFVPYNSTKRYALRDKAKFESWERDVDDMLYAIFSSPHFQADSDYAKVLAFNVDVVEEWNGRIRQLLHDRKGRGGTLRRIEDGDKLILNKPYLDYDFAGDKVVVFPNFTELSVESFHETTQYLPTPTGGSIELHAYQCRVLWNNPNTGDDEVGELRVLHEESQLDYNTLLEQWKDACDAIRRGQDKKAIAEAYRKKGDVETHFGAFGYNFALTVHRSQGSSFQFAILVENNIRQLKHSFPMSYKPCMYVGASRAKYCCILIGKETD